MIDPINPYPQLLQNAEKTIQEKTNRIAELEQELTCLQESYKRFIDDLNNKLQQLEEQYENLLDPLERALEQPNEKTN